MRSVNATEPFSLIVAYDDVTNIKPDPEPLLLALELAGADPTSTVYVGDDIVDHKAALSANVTFLGAGWASLPTFPVEAVNVAHPGLLLSHIRSLHP